MVSENAYHIDEFEGLDIVSLQERSLIERYKRLERLMKKKKMMS